MNPTRKTVAAVATAAVLTTSLTGCGGSPTYRPSAFGADNRCYYVNSPLEVDQLRRDGLCPSSWAAYPAPQPWLYRYGSYYYSPAYVNHYVPEPSRRSTLSTGTTFLRDHKSDVQGAQRDATYVTVKKNGTVGKTVPGTKIAKQVSSGKFGGGSARVTKQGGGSSRSGTCCKSHTTTRSTSHSSSHH